MGVNCCPFKELLGNIWKPQNTVRCQGDKAFIDWLVMRILSWKDPGCSPSPDGEILFRMESALMNGGRLQSAFLLFRPLILP